MAESVYDASSQATGNTKNASARKQRLRIAHPFAVTPCEFSAQDIVSFRHTWMCKSRRRARLLRLSPEQYQVNAGFNSGIRLRYYSKLLLRRFYPVLG